MSRYYVLHLGVHDSDNRDRGIDSFASFGVVDSAGVGIPLKALLQRAADRWPEGLVGDCRLPPPGWRCTRGIGHEGPCAAEMVPVGG